METPLEERRGDLWVTYTLKPERDVTLTPTIIGCVGSVIWCAGLVIAWRTNEYAFHAFLKDIDRLIEPVPVWLNGGVGLLVAGTVFFAWPIVIGFIITCISGPWAIIHNRYFREVVLSTESYANHVARLKSSERQREADERKQRNDERKRKEEERNREAERRWGMDEPSVVSLLQSYSENSWTFEDRNYQGMTATCKNPKGAQVVVSIVNSRDGRSKQTLLCVDKVEVFSEDFLDIRESALWGWMVPMLRKHEEEERHLNAERQRAMNEAREDARNSAKGKL